MNKRTYCMLIHFSVFAGYAVPIAGLIVPIVLWQYPLIINFVK